MLEVACERAQAILLDQVFFQLDNKKFQQFNLLLDAPVNSNPGLDRLMSIETQWKEI